jgi:hypothetical protein
LDLVCISAHTMLACRPRIDEVLVCFEFFIRSVKVAEKFTVFARQRNLGSRREGNAFESHLLVQIAVWFIQSGSRQGQAANPGQRGQIQLGYE